MDIADVRDPGVTEVLWIYGGLYGATVDAFRVYQRSVAKLALEDHMRSVTREPIPKIMG